MDLELSQEQLELHAVAKQMLDRHAPFTLARDYLEGRGDSAALWQAIAEVGWYGVGLERDDPFGVPGLCLLAEQCGSHVAPTLLTDTVVATRLAAAAPDPSSLAAMLSGTATVALAVIEERADWSLKSMETTAQTTRGGYLLNGVKMAVHHAGRADALAIVAVDDGGLVVGFVDARAEGICVESGGGLDPSTGPAEVRLADVLVARESTLRGGDAVCALEESLALGAIATAAEAIGAAGKALDMAVQYALDREQFGRAVGAFQAVQHLLADCHVSREAAWSTVLFAAAALDEGAPQATQAAAIAKAYASRASREVIEGAIQVFGGIAFTWEHDVHLLQRRVLECERRFGDALHHEYVLGTHLADREYAEAAT